MLQPEKEKIGFISLFVSICRQILESKKEKRRKTMRHIFAFAVFLLSGHSRMFCHGLASPSNISHQREAALSSRRNLLTNFVSAATLSTLALTSGALASNADEGDELIDVYFGCGCFWHVQHEFVECERRVLGRSDMEITARAGYAGGKAGMKDGKVRVLNVYLKSLYECSIRR